MSVPEKAVIHGVPGEWARVKGTVASLWPLFLAIFLCGAFAAALVLGSHRAVFAGVFVASLVFLGLMLRKGLRRVESFFVGARGEERVATALAALPSPYHVFHDFVTVHGLHVNHVVVGPAGVFAVETKNWRGPVTVEEDHVLVSGSLPSRSPVDQAVREAAAVRATAHRAGWDGEVAAVVCFASDSFGPGRAKVGAVTVINARDVVAWLESCPAALNTDEFQRLIQLMETHA